MRPLRLLPSLLLLALLALTKPAAAQEQGPLDAGQYVALLAETEAALVATPLDETRLAALADRWAGVTAVTPPGADPVAVDATYLARRLRDPARDASALAAELAALRRLLAAVEAPGPPAPADLQALKDILTQDEFAFDGGPAEPGLLERLQRRLLNGLARFLGWLDRLLGGSGAGTALGRLLRIVIPLVAVMSLAVILWRLLRSGLGGLWINESSLPEDDLAAPLTADSALRQAQALSGSGDYRTAVRFLYLSLLLSLEERGFIRYDRSLTNREYLRSVADRPDLARVLADIIDIFDRVWYGYQPISDAVYRRYEAQVEALRRRREAAP